MVPVRSTRQELLRLTLSTTSKPTAGKGGDDLGVEEEHSASNTNSRTFSEQLVVFKLQFLNIKNNYFILNITFNINIF